MQSNFYNLITTLKENGLNLQADSLSSLNSFSKGESNGRLNYEKSKKIQPQNRKNSNQERYSCLADALVNPTVCVAPKNAKRLERSSTTDE